jgi:hypothetical protein
MFPGVGHLFGNLDMNMCRVQFDIDVASGRRNARQTLTGLEHISDHSKKHKAQVQHEFTSRNSGPERRSGDQRHEATFRQAKQQNTERAGEHKLPY